MGGKASCHIIDSDTYQDTTIKILEESDNILLKLKSLIPSNWLHYFYWVSIIYICLSSSIILYMLMNHSIPMQGLASRMKKTSKAFDQMVEHIIKDHEEHKKEDPQDKDFIDIILLSLMQTHGSPRRTQ